MTAIRDLDHVVLRTAEAPAMVAFYRDVLGCEVERTLEELGLTQLRAGRALIYLVDVHLPLGEAGGPAPGRKAHNLDHFCVRLAEFDEASLRAHLAEHGIEAGETARRYGAEGYGPSIYIEDPDGNVVELKGLPEPA